MGRAAVDHTGAGQATTRRRRRGSRGNGRRLRRRIADAEGRRERARVELAPMDPWRAWTIARIDAELEQYRWEQRTDWSGEPGEGPRVPRKMPLPARPGVLPREVVAIRSLLRPWSVDGSAGPIRYGRLDDERAR